MIISDLNKYIDSLNVDIAKLKASEKKTNLYFLIFSNFCYFQDCNHGASLASNVPTSPQHDMLQILKDKLKSLQSTLDQTVKERDGLKEVKLKRLFTKRHFLKVYVKIQSNKKLESENSILIQEMQRLKANLNERNSQLQKNKYYLNNLYLFN